MQCRFSLNLFWFKIRITYGRKNFAAYIDPSKGEVDGESIKFADFVHLVVQGPKELADFISENKVSGESLGIDTGMVDGKPMALKAVLDLSAQYLLLSDIHRKNVYVLQLEIKNDKV